jgi:hypothetical protein
VKNAPENKKPATSEIAGCGLPKSELYLSYVGRITPPPAMVLTTTSTPQAVIGAGRRFHEQMLPPTYYSLYVGCRGGGKDSLLLGIITIWHWKADDVPWRI